MSSGSTSYNNNNNNNNNNDTSTLVFTAVGAALTGAAIATAAMRYSTRTNVTNGASQQQQQQQYYHIPQSTSSHQQQQHRNSLVFSMDESETTTTGQTSSSILFPHNHEEKMRRTIAARALVEEDNFHPRDSVTVRVPATSANMGPGYDTLGMAVNLWSEVTVTRADTFAITAEGEGAEEMPKDETNLLVLGCQKAFDAANKPMPTLQYHVVSKIPYARGLGSSSAAIVAGIIAGLVLAGHRLPCWGSEALLQIAAGIEGHPDNVAPVIYGGIQLGIHNGTRWVTERVPCPAGLQLVMFIPNFIGKTSDARGVLTDTISREDCAFNISRVAFLIHALCMGNLDNLKWGVQDRIHQPQRGNKLYKYLFPMIEAAEKAGASCAYLSGAGPTVMAITSGASGDIFAQREKERSDLAVARAMISAAEKFGISGKMLVTSASNEGARVVKVSPPFSTDNISFRDEI